MSVSVSVSLSLPECLSHTLALSHVCILCQLKQMHTNNNNNNNNDNNNNNNILCQYCVS
jgi:hypothetical protein